MTSASRSASSPASASWLAHRRRARCGRRRWWPARRGCPRRSTGPRGPARRRRAGCRRSPSRVSSAASWSSSPGSGATASTSSSPKREQVGLAGPLAGVRHDVVELGLDLAQAVEQGGPARQQLGERPGHRSCRARPAGPRPAAAGAGRTGRAQRPAARPPRPGRRPAPSRRPRRRGSAPRRRRCAPARRGRPRPRRRPPRPRPGARAGRGPAPRPRPARARAPTRTAPLSLRPPSSRPRAVTIMVLPAPVSPVITVRPGPSSSVEASMTPSELIRISSIMWAHRDADARWRRASPRPAGRTSPPAGP